MNGLLQLCARIDAFSRLTGRLIAWLVLATVLISVATAFGRKLGMGNNGWLEIQWYLFSAVFLLGAAHTLEQDRHVRVDVLAKRWSPRVRAGIDLVGHLAFLLPLILVLTWLGWTDFRQAWVSGEVSADAGGLIRWPVKLLIPLGFGLLALQVLSEVGKRLAVLVKGETT